MAGVSKRKIRNIYYREEQSILNNKTQPQIETQNENICNEIF